MDFIATTIMGATVVFLLLQVIVWVVLFGIIAFLLPACGVLGEAEAERIALIAVGVAEAILIVVVVHRVRRSIGPLRRLDESPGFEKQFETWMFATLAAGVAACLLMGLGAAGVKVAVVVIETFAALFLVVAIVTRWALTRKASGVAAVALCVTLFSLYLASR